VIRTAKKVRKIAIIMPQMQGHFQQAAIASVAERVTLICKGAQKIRRGERDRPSGVLRVRQVEGKSSLRLRLHPDGILFQEESRPSWPSGSWSLRGRRGNGKGAARFFFHIALAATCWCGAGSGRGHSAAVNFCHACCSLKVNRRLTSARKGMRSDQEKSA